MFKNYSNRALQNVKILDFSRVLAAPMTSMVLSDLGAQVWKIEKPGTGDDTRNWIPPQVNEQSCYFACVNRNKKSIALDLGQKEGQMIAQKLSKKCDILLENFKTGNMQKFGLDYETLREKNRELIYCSITGYGSDGPYASDPGYDVIAEAVGGFMKNTGPINGEPCKAAVAVTDIMTGLYAHGAILAALIYRDKTGRGQKIDCNLLSTQLAAMMNLASNYLNAGIDAKPWGTQHESIAPYQAFETSDRRHYVVGAGNDSAFKKLCEKMKLEELLNDPKYETNKNRVKHRDSLIEVISKRFKEEPLSYWAETLRTTHFPSGPVNSLDEAFNHPQVQALNLVKTVTHPEYGSIKVVGPPVKYSAIENEVRSAPPLLGEHTVEVLQQQLGFDPDTINGLKQRNVIDFP